MFQNKAMVFPESSRYLWVGMYPQKMNIIDTIHLLELKIVEPSEKAMVSMTQTSVLQLCQQQVKRSCGHSLFWRDSNIHVTQFICYIHIVLITLQNFYHLSMTIETFGPISWFKFVETFSGADSYGARVRFIKQIKVCVSGWIYSMCLNIYIRSIFHHRKIFGALKGKLKIVAARLSTEVTDMSQEYFSLYYSLEIHFHFSGGFFYTSYVVVIDGLYDTWFALRSSLIVSAGMDLENPKPLHVFVGVLTSVTTGFFNIAEKIQRQVSISQLLFSLDKTSK